MFACLNAKTFFFVKEPMLEWACCVVPVGE